MFEALKKLSAALGVASALFVGSQYLPDTNRTLADVVSKASVNIDNFCSGVLISPNEILTAAHCTNYGKTLEYKIEIQGMHLLARLKKFDRNMDLAVLEIPGVNLEGAVTRATEGVEVGEQIWCVGNPRGMLPHTVTTGIIGFQSRPSINDEPYARTQYSCQIAPGNSGGGVFNARMELVAIHIEGMMARNTEFGGNYGFGVEFDEIEEFLKIG